MNGTYLSLNPHEWPRNHTEDTNAVSKYSVCFRVIPWPSGRGSQMFRLQVIPETNGTYLRDIVCATPQLATEAHGNTRNINLHSPTNTMITAKAQSRLIDFVINFLANFASLR